MSSNRSFRVERSVFISAPAEKVHALIDDFHHWTSWSPYEGLDPELIRTYSGPDAGVGASYSWSGNRKAGAGTMTITESVPGSLVKLDLAFTKPFKNRNVTTFTLDPAEEGTKLAWAMTGETNTFMTLFGKFFPMDKLVGKDFEKGLAQLKAQAEKS